MKSFPAVDEQGGSYNERARGNTDAIASIIETILTAAVDTAAGIELAINA